MYLRSGQTLALGAAPRLRWIQQHQPAVYDSAEHMVMLSDWLAVRLGAAPAVNPSKWRHDRSLEPEDARVGPRNRASL